MVKPALVTEVLRRYAKPTALSNRFSALSDGPLRTHNSRSSQNIPGLNVAEGRDHSNNSARSNNIGRSDSFSMRDRSYSIGKRRRVNSNSDTNSEAGITCEPEKEVMLAELNSLIDKTKGEIDVVKEVIKVSNIDGTVRSILETMIEIQVSIVSNQGRLAKLSMQGESTPIVNIQPAGTRPDEAFPVTAETGARSKTTGSNRAHLKQAPLGNTQPWSEVVRRKPQPQKAPQGRAQQGSNNSNQVRQVSEEMEDQAEDPVSKFKKTIKDCERSLLIHGLDMGKTPTVNPSAMNNLATAALLQKACEVSRGPGGSSLPSEEDATVIQDVLSMASSVNFFGKRTKRMKKRNSEELEDFHTIPVEYKFADKGTRQVAEEILKKVCKVKTSVAYPANVRECIKQAYDYGKKKYKDSYVIVNLDVPCFRLVMKHRTKEESRWTFVKQEFTLPQECLNTSKKGNESVKLLIEQVQSPTRTSRLSGRSNSGAMDDETVFHSPNNHSLNSGNVAGDVEVCSNDAC